MHQSLRVLVDGLCDLFLPATCALCRASSSEGQAWLCSKHLIDALALVEDSCRTCAHPVLSGVDSCARCADDPPPWIALASAFALQSNAREVLLRAKLGGRPGLFRPLVDGLVERLAREAWAWGSVWIPVPLHRSRRRQRGFNQSDIVASWLADELGGSVRAVLVRVRATDPQGQSPARNRASNMHGAFRCRRGRVPKRAILVDDVYTSGSTLRECARQLRRAGCEQLYAATCCRTLAR